VTNNQNKKVAMQLHPAEAWLINQIRNKYRWGEILLETRDGLPSRVGRTTIFEKFSYSQETLTSDDTVLDNG